MFHRKTDKFGRELAALEKQRLDGMAADRAIKRASELSRMPGISVGEVREAWGLAATGIERIDNLRLNLPEGA